MYERFFKLMALYRRGANDKTKQEARRLLRDARVEQDRLMIAGENISDISKYISEVEYFLYEYN